MKPNAGCGQIPKGQTCEPNFAASKLIVGPQSLSEEAINASSPWHVQPTAHSFVGGQVPWAGQAVTAAAGGRVVHTDDSSLLGNCIHSPSVQFSATTALPFAHHRGFPFIVLEGLHVLRDAG